MGRSKMKIKTVEMVSRLQKGHMGTRMSPLPTPYSSSQLTVEKKWHVIGHGLMESHNLFPQHLPSSPIILSILKPPTIHPPMRSLAINLLHHSGLEPRFVKELDKAILVLCNSTTPVYILVLIYCMCYCLSHIYKSIRINQAIKSHQEFP